MGNWMTQTPANQPHENDISGDLPQIHNRITALKAPPTSQAYQDNSSDDSLQAYKRKMRNEMSPTPSTNKPHQEDLSQKGNNSGKCVLQSSPANQPSEDLSSDDPSLVFKRNITNFGSQTPPNQTHIYNINDDRSQNSTSVGNRALQTASTNHPLPDHTDDDLSLDTLVNTLNSIASKCYALGLQLGVHYSQLDNIRFNCRTCEEQLCEMLKARLKQEPPLRWTDVIAALRTEALGESRLACKIEKRFIIMSSLTTVTMTEPCNLSSPDQVLNSSPVPSDERLVCEYPILTQTSITPPPNITTPSSLFNFGVQTTAAVDISGHPECHATDHQSKIIDEVIDRHEGSLIQAIGDNLQYFSDKFISLGFISKRSATDICSRSINNTEKGCLLLSLIVGNFNTLPYKKKFFDKFVSAFACESAYEDLAISMTRDLALSLIKEFKFCVPRIPSSGPLSHGSILDNLAPEVKSFISHVKTSYMSKKVERNTSVVKWPPTPSKIYINLACIDRQSTGVRHIEYAKVTEAMVRDGNVDAILNVTKGPIDFSEIAKGISVPNRTDTTEKQFDEARLILVEGAPGVGKSTFAWEFCRRWERGEIAQQYQLVLLLRLREERICNAKCLEDLIYHPLKGVAQAVCHELVRSHAFHTLIILEGFDELPNVSRSDQSLFMELIAGEVLPLATVLVTSRPWATERIRRKYENRIYQHIEILGFTDKQIAEYIESTLPQDKVRGLEAYLDSHPPVRAGMYIPLNSAIVVTVYDESQNYGSDMPTTLTELYTSLARTLLLRYLCGHNEHDTDYKFLRTFKDLPPVVYSKFCKLCELAYNGTVAIASTNDNASDSVDSSHMIISHPVHHYKTCEHLHLDFDDNVLPYCDEYHGIRSYRLRSSIESHKRDQVQLIFRDLPSDFDDLGFMDSVTELYVTQGAVSSYNFLHLTFQEFFSAVHISTLTPAQQAEHFKKHMEGRLKIVLQFLAGLNKLSCFSREHIVTEFMKVPPKIESSQYYINCDISIGLYIIQWLFEAQSTDVIEGVLGQKTVYCSCGSLTKLLPLDYFSLGYCISNSKCQWVLAMDANTGEDEVRMLAAGGNARKIPHGRVIGLLRPSKEEGKTLPLPASPKVINTIITECKNFLNLHQLFLELPSHYDQIKWQDLSSLRVLHVELNHKPETTLNTLLPHLTLHSLAIDDDKNATRLQYKDYIALRDHVTSTTSLKEFFLSTRTCDKKGLEVLTAAFACNRSLPLEKLELKGGFTFSGTAAESLGQFITSSIKLQHLSLQRCTFCVQGLQAIVRGIHHQKSSMLYCSLKVLHLNVNGNNETKELTELLVEYPDVTSCIYVDYVKIRGITDFSAVNLAKSFYCNPSIKRLDLSNNTITDIGAQALAEALTYTTTLNVLNLSGNSDIGKVGTSQLVQALTVNISISNYCGLILPRTCLPYAEHSLHYPKVNEKIGFF